MDLQYGDLGYTCMNEKAEKGWCFSAPFSGIIIFCLELYLGDQVPNVLLKVTQLMRYRPIKLMGVKLQ